MYGEMNMMDQINYSKEKRADLLHALEKKYAHIESAKRVDDNRHISSINNCALGILSILSADEIIESLNYSPTQFIDTEHIRCAYIILNSPNHSEEMIKAIQKSKRSKCS